MFSGKWMETQKYKSETLAYKNVKKKERAHFKFETKNFNRNELQPRFYALHEKNGFDHNIAKVFSTIHYSCLDKLLVRSSWEIRMYVPGSGTGVIHESLIDSLLNYLNTTQFKKTNQIFWFASNLDNNVGCSIIQSNKIVEKWFSFMVGIW